MKPDQEKVVELLKKYRAGEASDEDNLMIEMLLENGRVNLEDLDDVRFLERKIDSMETPATSFDLDNRFYGMLADEKRRQKKAGLSEWFSFDFLLPRLALGAFTLITGIGVGYIFFNYTNDASADVKTLSGEVRDLKEMMMLSLLENESATDRLKAVSLSGEIIESSDKVTRALIQTLNNDENANVRLAALEALKPFCGQSEIRKTLIESIARQDSPLVQIALAELMVSLQEKSSVNEFQKILKNKKTPAEVRKRIAENIKVLI